MTKNKDINAFVRFMLFILLFLNCTGTQENAGPGLPTDGLPVFSGDWLVHKMEMKTELLEHQSNDNRPITLHNGLISRTFSTTPNGATIGFEDLRTAESILRSVRPEALVEIDGIEYEVGGLQGQPVHNYLKKSWIKDMKANPGSFKYSGYSLEDIKQRFPWRKRMEWLPKDVPWPPKGKTLTMTYKADDAAINTLIGEKNSDIHRTMIMEDKFTVLSPGWKIFTSGASDRSSFINEGKAGEIMAMSNTAVYAEQSLPQDTRVIKCKLNNGTDISNSHGLGMAVVFADKTIRLAFAGTYGLAFFDGEETHRSRRESYTPYFLRMEIRGNELIASVSRDNRDWQEVGKAETGGKRPMKVRLGKTDMSGNSTDGENKGDRSRCHVEYFCILGDLRDRSKSDAAKEYEYLKDIEVQIHYSMYDGLPLLSKWLTVHNNTGKAVQLNSFTSEILAAVEPRNDPMEQDAWMLPNISVITDFACGGSDEEKSYRWTKDPLYLTQIDYRRRNPCLLVVEPEYGPEQSMPGGETFESYRVWELIHEDWDRERKGLALRKTWRTVAPWITENPILMHVRSADDESVKKAIDQCADVGFQMVIMTFGSGFNIEDDSEDNIERMQALADYAHSKGIALGGYSLLASRRVSEKDDVVMPVGLKPRFGNSPCLGSEWGQHYFNTLYKFYEKTGCDILEHDGSYPGDVCASTNHPGHTGLADSRWEQFQTIKKFYNWCRSEGIYLNVPDIYYLNGSSKTGMGYRETNWSLPRAEQEIIERQNIYDGTWEKTPSQGWMFVPLVQYHGGGEAATIEPLKEHLPHYEQRLANLFGGGVQACYRGPQLYDAPETRAVVKKWVDFYTEHRAILNADIIHIRRPDGQNYDAILHVDPTLDEKGLLMVYNPLEQEIKRNIKLSLYYTGLSKTAMIAEQNGTPVSYELDSEYMVSIPVSIPAKSQTYLVIK